VNLSICDVCDDYCDIYDACDEYYDIYDACDEYYDIYDIPVIFGYFKREKQKNAMVTLSCVFRRAHDKVTKNQ
jgi:predicted solute-binding protein